MLPDIMLSCSFHHGLLSIIAGKKDIEMVETRGEPLIIELGITVDYRVNTVVLLDIPAEQGQTVLKGFLPPPFHAFRLHIYHRAQLLLLGLHMPPEVGKLVGDGA